MKLRALRLWNVRKFANRGIALENIGDGVNVLSEGNEFGKSTSFDALHAVFFQPYSGTPKAVQMLRPYSGGSPQVEVDIETDAGRVRISKQYYNGKHAIIKDIDTNRIIAQADEAETWLSNLLRGGSSGPAGLLWVQQGATDIGGGSKTEKDDERKVRENLLASVTGDQVELLTGGRRMVRVLDRTVSELDKLVTSRGAAKTSGPYFEAKKQLALLEDKENGLAIQIEALRSDLDNRRIKSKRLIEITDPKMIEQRALELNQTKLKLQEATDHAEQLAFAENKNSLALKKQSLAKQGHDAFLLKTQNLSKLTQKLNTDRNNLTEIKEKLDLAQTADQTSRDALEACNIAVEKMTQKWTKANLAQASLDATNKLEDMRNRLSKTEKIYQEIIALETECKALSIDDHDINILDRLTADINILQSKVQIESGSLKIDYVADNSAFVLMDGIPLENGKTISMSSIRTLDIPNIGNLTITPSSLEQAEDMHNELRATSEKLIKILEKLGVENITKAKEQQTIFKAKSSTLMIKKAELQAHSPEGLDRLRSHVADLEAKISPIPSEPFDVAQVEKELEPVKSELQKANSIREIARTAFYTAREAHIKSDTDYAHTHENFSQLEEGLGSELERNSKATLLFDDLERETKEAKQALALVTELRSNAPDLDTINASYARLNSIKERSEAERESLGREIAGLDGRIAISSDDAVEEEFEETRDQREAAQKRVALFEHEIEALQMLRQALENARVAAKEQFFQPVMTELKPLLKLLLDEASITFDDTTLLPQTLARKGQDEDISALSGGMREQLAILTRLAFARLLAKEGHPVPVILDDALVYSDDNRIERMFDALHRQASDIQILVFTCRQRAFEKLGGNGLRPIEWQPNH
jgi:DNA repair exonuclease SbcCD ATPase subunit